MRPIRLHLDTSDYAAMYCALPGTTAARVRDELREMTEKGRIEIGLSYHVVFELLQKAEPKFRPDRLARARLLKQLCGQNAFPYPSDLGQGYRFSTEGLWLPRADLDEIEIERLVQNVMQTMANCPELNRHERKVISKRSYFVEWVRNTPSKSKRLLADKWPLLFGREFEESGDFRRYILGDITRIDANKKLRFYITDPVAVYETWFENYGRDNPVPERRDQIANKLVEMLSELKEKSDEAAALQKAIAKASENVANAGAREALMELGRKLKTFRSEITAVEEKSKDPAWIRLFGEEATQIAAQIFYGFYSEKRDLKPSDAIDLIHAMYLPHTDLWRGDKAFSSLLIKNRVNFYERVVPTLSELPGRIETEAARRCTS
ncbi:MAG: hypothetical protein WBG11_03660 [Methylocella sp.]